MSQTYDAIIVGGGHNGLTCGNYLARSGKSVLVLEKRHAVGGGAFTEEFAPGHKISAFSFIMGHLHPKVIRELELERYGLESVEVDNVLNPTESGDDAIVFSRLRPQQTIDQIARFSKKDAENYPKFFASLTNAVELLRRLQLETPIDPFNRSPGNMLKLAKFGWRYRDIGTEAYDLIEGLSMSARDYVERWFETDIVKAKLMYWATIGGTVGPYNPGTAFYLIAHLVGQNGMKFAKGGMGQISEALKASGEAHGMEVRCNADVAEVLVSGDRAYGVRLANGEEIHAKAVVSNISAKIMFGKTVAREKLPEDFMQHIDSFRARGMSFKLLCAVDKLPEYKSFDADKAGIDYPAYAHIGPTPEYLERAFDEAKYGWYSSEPFLSPIVPSYYDPSLAPEGKHVVSIYGGVTPYEIKNSNWDAERDNVQRNCLRVMDRFAPGFSESVTATKLYLPTDLEDELGMVGGNSLHGELTLDQMFMMRPAPGYADYRSPITNLFQCGASCHPGGSVSAVPGHNAAREILADWSKVKKAAA